MSTGDAVSDPTPRPTTGIVEQIAAYFDGALCFASAVGLFKLYGAGDTPALKTPTGIVLLMFFALTFVVLILLIAFIISGRERRTVPVPEAAQPPPLFGIRVREFAQIVGGLGALMLGAALGTLLQFLPPEQGVAVTVGLFGLGLLMVAIGVIFRGRLDG